MMTDEERQRQMDFILEQQAKFFADIEALKEAQAASRAESEQRFKQLERGFVNLSNVIFDVVKLQRENAEQIAELREAQRETDERLNAFILVLERDIAARQNGRKRGASAKKKNGRKGRK